MASDWSPGPRLGSDWPRVSLSSAQPDDNCLGVQGVGVRSPSRNLMGSLDLCESQNNNIACQPQSNTSKYADWQLRIIISSFINIRWTKYYKSGIDFLKDGETLGELSISGYFSIPNFPWRLISKEQSYLFFAWELFKTVVEINPGNNQKMRKIASSSGCWSLYQQEAEVWSVLFV